MGSSVLLLMGAVGEQRVQQVGRMVLVVIRLGWLVHVPKTLHGMANSRIQLGYGRQLRTRLGVVNDTWIFLVLCNWGRVIVAKLHGSDQLGQAVVGGGAVGTRNISSIRLWGSFPPTFRLGYGLLRRLGGKIFQVDHNPGRFSPR